MKIGGFQELSLLDFPGTPCAIIWTVGCNFNCPFCYNPQLVNGSTEEFSEEDILSFLKKRAGMLEGVSITGGEPLLQPDIGEFLEKVKALGYKTKVDHNGSFPEALSDLLDRNLIDFVSMDVKTTKGKYGIVSGRPIDKRRLEKSIRIVMEKAPDYEFRTTMVPGIVDPDDVVEIARWLNGASRLVLQQFKTDEPLLDTSYQSVEPYSRKTFWETVERVRPFVSDCQVRGL